MAELVAGMDERCNLLWPVRGPLDKFRVEGAHLGGQQIVGAFGYLLSRSEIEDP